MGATINNDSFKLSDLILCVVLLQYSSSFPQNDKMSCGFHLGKVFPYYTTNREPDGISDCHLFCTGHCKSGNFRENFIFANGGEKHICDV